MWYFIKFHVFWGFGHRTRIRRPGLFSTFSLYFKQIIQLCLDTNSLTCKWSNLCHRKNAGHRDLWMSFPWLLKLHTAQLRGASHRVPRQGWLFLLPLFIHEDVRPFGSHAAPLLTRRSMDCYINYLCTLPKATKRTRRALTHSKDLLSLSVFTT